MSCEEEQKIELSPCAKCSNSTISIVHTKTKVPINDDAEWFSGYFVECVRCLFKTRCYVSENAAVNAWNVSKYTVAPLKKGEELLPCPFCGSSDIVCRPLDSLSGGAWWKAQCQRCKTANGLADSQGQSVSFWNKRHG